MPDLTLDRKREDPDGAISLLALANFLLRWRRMILGLSAAGAVLGLAIGLLTPRVYTSTATFLPQGAEGNTSGLAAAASQFGIRVPTSGGGWGAAVYVELLHSRALLEPIARDTMSLSEEGGKRTAIMDLLKVKAPKSALRTDLAVRRLLNLVKSREVKALGAVEITATTEWPSLSLFLAQRLVSSVNQFNLETRKSQATAERQFVETQVVEAEAALRAAEDRLQLFFQGNRAIAESPELSFQRDRLQREVTLRQQVYTTLMQSREDAKIREVRDTPVITVLESAGLPVVSDGRKSIQKGLIGGLAGGMLGVLLAFVTQGIVGARREPNEDSQEFFQLVEAATPRFLRRRGP